MTRHGAHAIAFGKVVCELHDACNTSSGYGFAEHTHLLSEETLRGQNLVVRHCLDTATICIPHFDRPVPRGRIAHTDRCCDRLWLIEHFTENDWGGADRLNL